MSTVSLLLAISGTILLLLAVGAWVLARKLRRLRSMVRRLERHAWETQNVFRVLQSGGPPLTVPGGWAASTDLLGELLRAIAAHRPRCVVELGSGLSTVVLAAGLRANGEGRLISIDADETYAASTRRQLALHGLEAWAEVRCARLVELEFEGVRRPWYDTQGLQDLQEVGLLLIDGPPTERRADIRYPSLPFFWPRLAADAIVLLDDAARPAERDISRRWQRAFPGARYEYLHLEKGALRISRVP